MTKLVAKLIRQGGFVRFGATLGPGRNVKLLMPESWKENATRDEVEMYWSRELKKAVDMRVSAITVCSCADVRIPLENGNLLPASLFTSNRVKSCGEDIVYPYQKGQDSEVKLGIPTSVQANPWSSPRIPHSLCPHWYMSIRDSRW